MEEGGIQPWSLGSARVRQLQRHPDEQIKERSLALIEHAQGEDRQAVYDRYLPALRLTGDPARGKQIFQDACSDWPQDRR